MAKESKADVDELLACVDAAKPKGNGAKRQKIEIEQTTIGVPSKIRPPAQIDDPSAKLMEIIINEFGQRVGEIWKEILSDRALIDKYIGMFTTKVSHDDVKAVFVESLTSLINAKANTSINASRMLDSIAKMTAAVKNIKIDSGSSVDLGALINDDDPESGFDPNAP